MKKLLSLVLCVIMTGSVFTFTFAEGTTSENSAASPKSETSQQVTGKKEAMKALAENRKTLVNTLKADKEELQKTWAAIKDRNQKVKALKAEIQPLQEQKTTLQGDLKSQKETMKSYNQDLKTAYESKDYTKAGSVLGKMAELKAGISSNLSKLVEIKNKILEKVKSMA